EQSVDAAREKEHGLTLELELPLLVALEDGAGARSVRAVVQERDVPVEQELVAHARVVRHPSYGSRRCLRAPGRSVRARTGRPTRSPVSSASARSRQACSSGAATATPTRRARSSPASSRCGIRSSLET